MKRLLTKENKRSIKNAYRSNAIFRVINAAYKDQETQMKTLRFSPEEIWANCLYGFDQILKSLGDIEVVTERMWNDTFCELRDDAEEAGRNFEEKELETATSCILYSIIACLVASGEWNLNQHTVSLMSQIAERSDLDTIALPFDKHIDACFIEYVKGYIDTRKFISEKLDTPQSYVDPIKPLATAKDRLTAKEGVKKRLEFMKGVSPDGETMIMTTANYNKMIEAAEYLIENNVVQKQDTKILTHLPVAHLRYTFYLVYKNEGKCIKRKLWLEFLGETFSQMKDNQASLSKHFSDKPDGYDSYLKQYKKKK